MAITLRYIPAGSSSEIQVVVPFGGPDLASVAQSLLDQASVVNEAGQGLPDYSAYYRGNGSPSIPGAANGLVVLDDQAAAGSALVTLSSNTALAIVDRTSPVTVFGALGNTNETVMAGNSSGLVYVNRGKNTTAYFGGNASGSLNSYVEGGSAPNGGGDSFGTVNVSTQLFVNEAHGITEINAYDGAQVYTFGPAWSVVNAVSGRVLVGNQTGGSTTVNAAAGVDLGFVPIRGGAVINPVAGHTTIFAGSGQTQVNLAATDLGSTTVAGAIGSFVGGKAGHNLLFAASAGGTPSVMVGGGDADTLVSAGSLHSGYERGTQLLAGPGRELLYGAEPDTTFKTGEGADTIVADARGGNALFVGSGTSFVFAGHAAGSTGNFFNAIGNGVSYIDGFQSGLDKVGGPYDLYGFNSSFVASNDYFSASNTTRLVFTSGATLWFFDAHILHSDISGM